MSLNNQSLNLDARQILLKRGNALVTSGYVGPVGEVTLNTTTNTLIVHDGTTPGGHPMVSIDNLNTAVADAIAEIEVPVGATGPQGETGATGIQGFTGYTGSRGIQGATGLTGATGEIGYTGSKGITGATGPQGAQGDMGATGLQGEQGATGLQGIQGATGLQGDLGATGPQGNTGETGSTGATGPQGNTGATGPQGNTGATGPIGDTGSTGATGVQGETGATGPAGTSVTILGSYADLAALEISIPVGNNGDAYILTDSGHLAVWNGTSWSDVGNIRGPEGNIGATGPQGDMGATGLTGPQGDMGATGPQGDMGATGPQGDMGATGLTGATGPQGETGATGLTGEQGILAQNTEPTQTDVLWLDTSVSAIQGIGATGATGAVGATGVQGVTSQPTPPDNTEILWLDLSTPAIQGVGATGATGPAGASSWDDLTNKPTIPANTSDLNNDSGFITSNVSADIVPTTDNTVDLGSPTNRFRHLYVAPGTIYLGDIKLTNLNGKLAAKKVINPGEENEQEDEEDSDAFSDVRGGGAGLGDFTIDGSTLQADAATIKTIDGDLTLESDSDVIIRTSGGNREVIFNNLGGIELPGIEGSNYNIGETEGGLQLSSGYNFYINTNTNGGTNCTWSFQDDGDLRLPLGGDIIDANGNSVLGGGGGGGANIGNFTFTDNKITFPDGTVQTTAYVTGQQYGFINQFIHSSTDDVDMEAVAVDADGNSYVSYSYYDNSESKRYGGIVKLDSTGSVQWNKTLASSNTDGQYPQIASLEHVTANATNFLVTIGTYYDNNINKDRGFMWFVNPADGSVGSQFDIETAADVPVNIRDAVFGADASGNPFAVLVGDTYDETLPKTFTPLVGSGLNKLVVSWSEFNASGVLPGEDLYYTVGGNYNIRLNSFDTMASPTGTGNGLYLQVSINQDGTYNILRANGWSGEITSWGNPANIKVLGSTLGGVDGVNDLTFDFNPDALNNNSNNVSGWASNIQGTAISEVVGFGWGDKDWGTEVGNALTFEYRLNRQAYMARLGNNTWGKSFGSTQYEQLNSVVVDSNGNSYVAGYYSIGGKASLVAKFDIDGNQQWAVHIDPAANTSNEAMSIDLLSDGNVIVVDEEGYVTKLNGSNGSILWQVRVDPNDDISWDSDFKGTATPDGNYIFTNYEDNNYTLYILCVSGTDGSEVWSKRISRNFGGSNGEIYPQDDYNAQCIDCNTTSVTIAASTYLYFNNNSTYAGLIINLPVDGENTDGVYGQYIVETVTPGWSTETTTSTSASINVETTPVTVSPASPTSATNTFTMTENVIGAAAGPNLGDITFDGSKLSSPATFTGDFPNGVITLAPGNSSDSNYADNGQFINIYPTNQFDAPHIHVAPGEGINGTGDLILGTDNYHIDVNHNGSIYIKTNNQNHSWEFDTSGYLRLPYGGDILDSSGNSVLGGGGSGSLPRASVINTYDPDVTCDTIRVMMNNGVITVREAGGGGLALLYSGRTVSAGGTQTVLSTGGTSVNAGEALTLATLANKGDSMIIDYLYDANTNKTYRINVMVTWSSLPYGGIIVERIA